eukprot:CAMPEP_0174828852 /NCGR_PEP_ID=MMETSP1114-20130205/1571_1 /TAXON_ID=312471 /ORGANISM="Neobodo designis, Strain CCAP 1951/1" /LENGTH=606 /DNA_ID=CAMNT_0016062579 /DNA_START=37 /DNA_END=1857 /DNA_ORIENTATION=-
MESWIESKLAEEQNSKLHRAKARLLGFLADFRRGTGEDMVHAPSSYVAALMAAARVLALDEREAFVVHGYNAKDSVAVFTRQPEGASGPVPVLTNWVEQKAARLALRFLESAEAAPEGCKEALATHCGTALRPDTSKLSPPSRTPSVALLKEAGVESGDDGVAAIVEDPSGAGNGSLVAVRSANAFAPLLRIPGRLLFNLDTVRRYCDLGMVLNRAAWKKMLDDEGEALLLTCFIYEAAKWRATGKSNWAQLLQTCPRHFPGVPTMWGAHELQHLAGTSVLDEVAMKQATLAAFSSSMQSLLTAVADKHSPIFTEVLGAAVSELSGGEAVDDAALTTAEKIARVFSEEQYQWARCVFDSRSFHLLHGGARVLVTLAPVADMINHTASGSDVLSRRIDEATGEFVLELAAGFDAKEVPREVVMCYGPLQTWELLLSYGFVPTDDGGVNPHDRLPFSALDGLINVEAPAPAASDDDEDADEAAADDGYDEQRRAIIAAHGLDLVDQLFIPVDGVVPPVVRAVLRLCQAEAEEFPQLHANPFASGPAYLDERVSETLRSFATSFVDTVAVDDEAAAMEELDSELKSRVAMAFELRRRLVAIAKTVATTA